jgi:hypothetical protein
MAYLTGRGANGKRLVQESRIVAVGHKSFFQEMCGVVMGNVSVWRATLTAEGRWEGLTMLYDTPDIPAAPEPEPDAAGVSDVGAAPRS